MRELLQQANGHRTNGEYEQAQALYEQLVAEEPGNTEAWWGLAHTVMNQGDFDTAREHFRQAVELAPQNQRFLCDFAMLYTMLGQHEEAKPLFERVIEIDATAQEATEAKKQLSYYEKL